ncbi:HAMP domain-containing sensor histidine kinase [uncultured Phocaeicola sp.]|nr:HAMP domain-containing sensor histidine kinase [uncultured Phocaeicola sp.]
MSRIGRQLMLLTWALLACTLSGWGGVARRVLVIHSYEESYAAYPDFNRKIADAFAKRNMEVDLRVFYLDCESYLAQAELERMYYMIDSVRSWHPELILVNEDQATYSLLKCGHPYLKKIPIVFGGVNYPNWPLIRQYPNVTGFHDKMEIKENIDFAKALLGDEVHFFAVMDSTFFDKKIEADMHRQLKDENILWIMDRKTAELKLERTHKLTFHYIPMRNSTNGYLAWNMSKYQHNSCYLQCKRDFTTVNVSNLAQGLTLTMINDGFGQKEKLLGGYLTMLDTQVEEEVETAVRLLNGENISKLPIRESRKDYVVDWNVMAQLGWGKDRIPGYCKIINIPFKDEYPVLWLFLVISITIWVGLIISWLLFLYLREQRRKKRVLLDLADKNETLELAIEGSNTFAWKLQNESLVFETAFWKSQNMPDGKLTIEDLVEVTHPNDKEIIYNDWKEHLYAKKKIVQVRCDFNDKGYQWWEFRYTTTRLATGEYRTAGLLLNVQNIKDKEHELEEARRLAEKAELKESFLTNMSHEIRTPLNAIVGFANVINAEEDLSKEEKQEYVNIINVNTEQLLKLINDILEISRLDSGQMSFDYTMCDVSELVNDVYQTHSVLIPSCLQFLKEIPSGVSPRIYVDRGRVMQVLTNFLNNACKFTQQGYIKLGWEYAKATSEVYIYVEDTGKGIPAEERNIIFSRFYKQDEFAQGTGLGLSICKAIIEKLHGKIELWSEVGKGSCFSIVLPCQV